jgi:hypothetical protein
MKKQFLLLAMIVSQTLMAQNVGIGTSIPDTSALLHINLGTSTAKGVLITGTYDASSTIPNLGAGSRMMFYPGKGAFRAGAVGGTQWNNANVGTLSFAAGASTKASGSYSTALGQGTIASGNASIAMGQSTNASGSYSTALGYLTTASGYVSIATGESTNASGNYSTALGQSSTASGFVSIAMGQSTNASGNYSAALGQSSTAFGNGSVAIGQFTTASGEVSTAMGSNISAKSGYETVLGTWNTDYTPVNTGDWDPADRLFTIGNGTSSSSRSDAITVLKNGNTGIGTSTPDTSALLHIDLGTSTTKGLLVTGTYDAAGTVPDLGGGSHMMFYPGKGAFRAGFVDGTQWDNANVGSFSTAMGNDAIAIGYSSTAMGYAPIATGNYSTAVGYFAHASGLGSTSMGGFTFAKSGFETVLGRWNTNYTPSSTDSWDPTDRLFTIGNGTGSSFRSDALVVLKNGNTGIGISTPNASALLHIDLGTSTAKGVLITGTYDASSTIPNLGAGSRMMFYPGKGAFRTGVVDGIQWDNANVGDYSFATGANTTATGFYSTAMGQSTNASGYASIATGAGTTASGNYSTALGVGSTASGFFSTAMGQGTVAFGDESVAMGYLSTASATASFAVGQNTTASGDASTALGISTNASGHYSTAIGGNTSAKSGYETVLGRWNTDYTPLNTSGWDPADRLFTIGNGTSSSSRSDALVVLKNGVSQFSPGGSNIQILAGNNIQAYANGGLNLTTYSNDPIKFTTFTNGGSGSERMRILSNGNVGIGISTPNAPLAFTNTTGSKICLYESSPNSQYGFAVQGGQLQLYSDASAAKISFGYYSSGTFTERMYLTNSSGILTVAGTNYPSDARYKKQITRLQNPLEKIMAINGVEYFMRANEFPSKHFDDKLQVGLIAQEVEKVLPQAVQTGEDGYKAIDYARVVPLLVEGIKEQQHLIEKQQQQIDELKKLLEKLLKQ